MKTIVIPAGENAAISTEVIAAMNELSAINANNIGLVMNNAKSAPNVIVWGVLEQDGNLSIGLVSISGELLMVYDGVSTSMIAGPNLGCLEIVEDTNVISGTDDQGNSYNTTIKNRYCKPSATGTALSLFRRATLATKEGTLSYAQFPDQNIESPFSRVGDLEATIDQFSKLTFNLDLSAPSQTWASGWLNILTLPADLRPNTSLDYYCQLTVKFGYYPSMVPCRINSNGVLAVYIPSITSDILTVYVRLKY